MSEYSLTLAVAGASLSASLGNVTNISATVALAGPQGATGATGAQGPAGQGVPTGGTSGQYLRKSSSTNYETAWDTLTTSDISDFDTEVSNNTDVAANTAARHTHSNQTILNNTTASFTTADKTALDAKANDSAVVHLSGTETISGAKTFSSNVTVNNTAPALFLTESDQVAPAGAYRIDVSADKMRVIRSASVLLEVDGTAFDNKSRKITSLANGTLTTDAVNKSQLDSGLSSKVNGSTTITVGTTEPASPAVGDLWVDTN